MDKNENTVKPCCKTVECRDLSQLYIESLKGTIMHFEANQLICDHTKADVMSHVAHMLIVYATGLRRQTLTEEDLEKLHQCSIFLVPEKTAEIILSKMKENSDG